MLLSPLLLPPSAAFWQQAARAVRRLAASEHAAEHDLSGLRVIVPSFSHAALLKKALAEQSPRAFIPPRINTLSAWLAMQPPETEHAVPESDRLMGLYAELRQHAWLKKLFGARRNTDLLPLAQTLLALFDELSVALLPAIQGAPQAADERWHAALEQIAPAARTMLSNEAELVWSLWKSQIDAGDPVAQRYRRMMRLAEQADAPLVWINATEPDAMEGAFLAAYGKRQAVLLVWLDWRASAVPPVYATAWNEILEAAPVQGELISMPEGLSLCRAKSLEDEAVQGAQTVLDWLQEGKSCVAIVAQDRVVARRMRALLERAQVLVTDETGWKLSTTRGAAALAAWFDVIATRAETSVLLDLLKSPYVFAERGDKADLVMFIEATLLRENVLGGWEAVLAALERQPAAHALIQKLAEQARWFSGRKSLSGWLDATFIALDVLGMRAALSADATGVQVINVLAHLKRDCERTAHPFSFSEWRAFIGLHLESAPFIPLGKDSRVVMMQLAGARLRSFDAVLMVGSDAKHLPSQLEETLFFANAVRRELGLATREMRHRMQLRDFAELLTANSQVVLSWQSFKSGEPNSLSPWIERLGLTLERAGMGALPMHEVSVPARALSRVILQMPMPSAAMMVPERLSASAYNSLVACPYQFFATRMLQLSSLDELSDLPEKRDYGDWLHRILTTYHETVRDKSTPVAERGALLQSISEQVFEKELERSAAALGYYTRWQKAMPAYLKWANERESAGWRFAMGEVQAQLTLQWDGGQIVLHGRIDRIDENADGERAVLDYKTKNLNALRLKLTGREDHQLPFYGLLAGQPVTHAAYIALEPVKDVIGAVEASDYAEWQAQLEQRIVSIMRAIEEGASLSASGINSICQFCEVRGLCRKGAWE